MLLPVLNKRRFDFGFLPGTTSQSVVLQPAIDVSEYYYVQLWVRVHARDMTAGQTLELALYNTLPDEHDLREFTESVFTDVTLSSASPTSVPGLVYRESSSPGPYLKLLLTASQTSVTSTFYFEISAALNLRTA
jgi:hypothetical protein